MRAHVLAQVRALYEGLAAHVALVGPLSRVDALVHGHGVGPAERLVAYVALEERPLARVRVALVLGQLGGRAERQPAERALVALERGGGGCRGGDALVQVRQQLRLRLERLAAVAAPQAVPVAAAATRPGALSVSGALSGALSGAISGAIPGALPGGLLRALLGRVVALRRQRAAAVLVLLVVIVDVVDVLVVVRQVVAHHDAQVLGADQLLQDGVGVGAGCKGEGGRERRGQT